MPFQSVLPPEALNPEELILPMEYCQCPYGQMAGRRDGQGKFVVTQMISTDPRAFLDSRYAPGQAVDMPPSVTS